jgi:hypothetical protein
MRSEPSRINAAWLADLCNDEAQAKARGLLDPQDFFRVRIL